MDYNSSWTLIGVISIIIIFYFIQIVKIITTRDELGKQSSKGSEIKFNKKLRKYSSIKEIPSLRNNIGKNITVVYFNHSKCSGCVELTPKFNFLAKNEYYKTGSNPISFININPQSDNIDFTSIGILFVPTVLIFDQDGDLIKNFIGLMDGSAELVIQEIREVLDSFYL